MSVPMLVGNITSVADYDRKNHDLHKLLKLRAQLNAKSEESTHVGDLIHRGEVVSTPVGFQSLEEKMGQINTQRNLAISNLMERKISAPIATNFVNMSLPSLDALLEFNQYWDSFQQLVVPGLIPSHLDQMWEQFKTRTYVATDDRASMDMVQDEVEQMGRGIMEMIDGGAVDYAVLEKHVKDATRRFDVPKLRTLSQQVYQLKNKFR